MYNSIWVIPIILAVIAITVPSNKPPPLVPTVIVLLQNGCLVVLLHSLSMGLFSLEWTSFMTLQLKTQSSSYIGMCAYYVSVMIAKLVNSVEINVL